MQHTKDEFPDEAAAAAVHMNMSCKPQRAGALQYKSQWAEIHKHVTPGVEGGRTSQAQSPAGERTARG